jgi:tetratricopeptide (TPR) repeat protein
VANDLFDFVQRGKVLIVRRQFQEAARVCRLGLLGQPQLLEGRLVLGMALMALGRYEEVLGEMRVALDIDERSALAWLLRGEALALKGDYQQAEKVLLRAKQLDPSNEKADKLLADIRTALAAGMQLELHEPIETREYPNKLRSDVELEIEAARDATRRSAPPEGDPEPTMVGEPDTAQSVLVDEELLAQGGELYESTFVEAMIAVAESKDVVVESKDVFVDGDEERTPPAEEPNTAPVAMPPLRPEDQAEKRESSYEEPAVDDYAEAPRKARPDGAKPVPTPLRGLQPRAGRPAQPQPYGGESVKVMRPAIIENDEGIEKPTGDVPLLSLDDLEEEEGTVQGRKHVPAKAAVPPKRAPPPQPERPPPPPERPPPRSSGAHPVAPAPPATPATIDRPAAKPVPTPARPVVVAPPPPAPAPLPQAPPKRPQPVEKKRESVISTARVGVVPSQLSNDPPSAPTTPMQRHAPRDLGTVLTRRRPLPFGRPRQRMLLLVGGAAAAVMLVAGITGVLLREYRVRLRIERHREAARQRMASGTYAGYQAAAEEYRRILVDRPNDEGARAARARIGAAMAFEFGDPADPAAHAVSALGDENSEDAQIARAYVALARGDLARARRLANQAEELFADAAPRYVKGRVQLLLDRPDDAAQAIAAAVERDPRDPLLLHGLGLAEAARRRDAAAMDAFSRALDLSPNHVATIVDRAALQIQRGKDLSQAEGYLQGVVAKLSGEASPAELGRAYLALGQLKLQQGDLEQGRSMLIRASAKRPDGDVVLSEGLAAAYLQAFELDAAETEARRAIDAARGRSAGYLTLAQVALLRGRAQEALSDVEEAGTSKPEALLVRGRAFLALGKVAQARADLDEAVRIAPDLVEARVERTRVDIAEGHASQAQRELERMERGHLAPALVADGLATALLAQRQPDRARYWFAKAVERNPLALDARLELARLYLDDGRPDDARAELKRAIEANAEFAPAWRELARLSVETSDLLAAREEYDALVAKSPSDAAALLGAARARLLLGDVAGADERIARADRIGAAGEEVVDLRALALLRGGKPMEAVGLLRPALATAQRPETAALFMEATTRTGHPLAPQMMARVVPARLRGTLEVMVAEARTMAEAGRSSAAEARAKTVLARSERAHVSTAVRAEALAVLGRSYYDQGSVRPAQRMLDAAVKLDPHNPRALYQLAIMYDDRFNHAEALRLMESAAKADPALADAQIELGRLRSLNGAKGATEAYENYLKLEPNGPYADEARRGLRLGTGAPRPVVKAKVKPSPKKGKAKLGKKTVAKQRR